MKYIKRHITLLFIMVWHFSFSQDYTNYSIKEGLPSNHVYRITQDYEGFIWIITDKGISKYDGKTFKNFTTKNGLPTNDIWHIRTTQDNKIWYFSKSNKLGYIFKDKVYAFPAKINEILFPSRISQSKNEIVFNSGRFVYQLKDSIWQGKKSSSILNTKIYNQQEISHSKIKAYSIDAKLKSFFLHKQNKKTSFPIDIDVLNFAAENGQINDSLCLVINKESYIVANLDREKVKQVTFLSQGLAKQQQYFRCHNVNNEIQFTGLNFVASLASNMELKDKIDIPKKLNSHFSFVDKTGNIWVATFNNGVFMLPKEKQGIKVLAKNKKIQALELVNNTLYTGVFQEGFFKLADTLYPIVKNKDFQYSISSIDNTNTLVLSSQYNVYFYKNKKLSTLNIHTRDKDSMYNVVVRKVIKFNGVLYGYTSEGIHNINPINYNVDKEFILNGVTSLSKNETHLFTGNQGGLIQLKNNQLLPLQSHSLFTKPVLSQENLDAKNIVVGSDGFGAYVTDGDSVQFIVHSKELSVQDIFIDSNKNIWMATQKGVHMASKENNKYRVIKSFYESDGLLSNNINSLVVKKDSLYVGSDIGLSILPLHTERTNQLQKIYIKSVLVNSKEAARDKIVFPYKNNNHVFISFGVLDFSNQQNLTYQYRLKPIQKDWTISKTLDINFTELAPEHYTLEFKVENHHKKELIKNISIEIVPRWYQTFWFKIGATLISIFVIALIAWWLSKKNQEKKNAQIIEEKKVTEIQLKALRSQMNPHFVFNSLAAIQYYINENNFEASDIYLVKFSKLIRQFFELSKETEINLSEEIKLIRSYLDIEKLRFREKFEYALNLDDKIDVSKMKLPTMLLQPIVENAINHGIFNKIEKGCVKVNFNYLSNKSIQVEIIDDGVGFVNTQNKVNKRMKSSNVLEDRLRFLNQSGVWNVVYKQEELYPDLEDKGNKSTFIITYL